MTQDKSAQNLSTPGAPAAVDREWDDAPAGSPSARRHGHRHPSDEAALERRNRVRPQPGNSRSDSQEGFGSMVLGAVLLVIGLVITIGSYSAASSGSGGGTYVVTYGLIIVGFLRLATGFFTWISNR